MAIKQLGIAVLNPGTIDETWGLCDDLEVAQEADKENIKNGEGDTIGLLYTDSRKKIAGNYTPLDGVENAPVTKEDLIGETLILTVHGTGQTISVCVDEASVKYTRGTVSTFAISGYYYPYLTDNAPAAPAPSGG